MVFVEQLSGFDEDDFRTLNYTYYGNVPMMTVQGVWKDVKMIFEGDVTNVKTTYEATVKVFLTNATNPDNGLDGTLGIALVPDTLNFHEICLLCKLK